MIFANAAIKGEEKLAKIPRPMATGLSDTLTDNERLAMCSYSMGKAWGSLRFLQLYNPGHPLKIQLEEIIKSLEADVTKLFYPDLPTPPEHS